MPSDPWLANSAFRELRHFPKISAYSLTEWICWSLIREADDWTTGKKKKQYISISVNVFFSYTHKYIIYIYIYIYTCKEVNNGSESDNIEKNW